jgi:excisionase family DNA binding protein
LTVTGDGTWLLPSEVASVLGVHVNTVHRYVADGRLDEPVKVRRLPSGHRRIHKDSVGRLQAEMQGDDTRT